jgi:hypothetical protein
MGLDHIRSEIEHMRMQVSRQRKEILQLQRAGISTASAELLLGRMLEKIDGLCEQREKLKRELPAPLKGRVLGRASMVERPQWYDHNADKSSRGSPLLGAARGLLLPAYSGDYRLDRPVRGSRFGKPRLLPEPAAWHRAKTGSRRSVSVQDAFHELDFRRVQKVRCETNFARACGRVPVGRYPDKRPDKPPGRFETLPIDFDWIAGGKPAQPVLSG